MSGPYQASEDSALLRSALTGRSGARALEIGAGNGGTLIALGRGFGTVVGTDLVLPGMTDWRDAGADYVIANGASCLREGAFDLVALNPPYLPEDEGEDPATGGGVGLEVPTLLLRDALRVVKDSGSVVMLLNNQARIENFEAECRKRGFRLKRIASRHLFFEVLSLYEASASGRRTGAPAIP